MRGRQLTLNLAEFSLVRGGRWNFLSFRVPCSVDSSVTGEVTWRLYRPVAGYLCSCGFSEPSPNLLGSAVTCAQLIIVSSGLRWYIQRGCVDDAVRGRRETVKGFSEGDGGAGNILGAPPIAAQGAAQFLQEGSDPESPVYIQL